MGKKKDFKDTPETLRQAILIMQEKILEHEHEFQIAPLSIEAEMRDGRYITRSNPLVQEYRSLVRDYSAALKAYRDLTGNEQDAEINSLDDIRARFKVAK